MQYTCQYANWIKRNKYIDSRFSSIKVVPCFIPSLLSVLCLNHFRMYILQNLQDKCRKISTFLLSSIKYIFILFFLRKIHLIFNDISWVWATWIHYRMHFVILTPGVTGSEIPFFLYFDWLSVFIFSVVWINLAGKIQWEAQEKRCI